MHHGECLMMHVGAWRHFEIRMMRWGKVKSKKLLLLHVLEQGSCRKSPGLNEALKISKQ